MSTHHPRPPYTPEELQKLYPKELELKQVQIILRHGERTPTNSRFRNAGLPAFWPYCTAAKHFTSAVIATKDLRHWDSLHFKRQIETFGKDDMPVAAVGPNAEFDAICLPGELTDRGRETTFALGHRLRHLYVDQLRFMPTILPTNDMIYLRSTPITRALESVQQTYSGMYPASSRAPNLEPPTIVTRSFPEETLFPNDMNCRRLAELTKAFAKQAAGRWNDSDEMGYVQKRIGKWMPAESPRVKVDSHPRLSGIMDTVNSTLAHGSATKLPKEFYDNKAIEIIERVACEEWFEGYKVSNEYRTLGIGGLAADIVTRMVECAKGEDVSAAGKRDEGERAGRSGGNIKFALSGAHDTTLAAFLASVGAFENERWPPYSSHIAYELFKRTTPSASNDSTSSTADPDQAAALGRSWLPKMLGGSSPGNRDAYSTVRKPSDLLTKAERAPMKDYFVRIRYNDQPKVLPACRAPGKHLDGDESFCTLEAFKEIVDAFTPRSWKEQCNQNMGNGVLDAKMDAISGA